MLAVTLLTAVGSPVCMLSVNAIPDLGEFSCEVSTWLCHLLNVDALIKNWVSHNNSLVALFASCADSGS